MQSIGQAMMSSRTASLVTGALAGIGFVVAVAALMLWLNTRLQTYLVFSIVSLVVMAYISASNGWWALVPALRNPFGSSLLSACVGFYVSSHAWLTAYVLNLRTNMPITGRVLRGVSYICAMLGLLVNVLTGAILPLTTLSLVAHVVWRLRIERAIWGDPDDYTGRRLDVLINRLRDKIRAANFPEPVLITHRQKGYQFVGEIAVVK